MGRRSRGRTEALLTVPVSAAELEAIKAHAQAVGASSMSDWVRTRLFAAMEAERAGLVEPGQDSDRPGTPGPVLPVLG